VILGCFGGFWGGFGGGGVCGVFFSEITYVSVSDRKDLDKDLCVWGGS
jgi:hypothetical protein